LLYTVVIILAASTLTAALLWAMRRVPRPHRLAIVGVLFLVCYVGIRALAHHSSVDRMLGGRLGSLKDGWVLELTGVFLIAASTLRQRPSPPLPGPGNSDEATVSQVQLGDQQVGGAPEARH
jgi:hypothetical protein